MARRDLEEMGRAKKVFWLALASVLLVLMGIAPMQVEKQSIPLPVVKKQKEKTIWLIKAPPAYLALDAGDGLIISPNGEPWRTFRR